MRSEAAAHADWSALRYAQCWEDADILLDGLEVGPGHTCVSIASAGDNTLALLSRSPARVIAIDLNPAQLAALELRVAAYRELSHGELLELMGSRPSTRREALYQRCRSQLGAAARGFWDARSDEVARGIGAAGRFERYLALFREWVLPLVHPRARVAAMLERRAPEARAAFYRAEWDRWRWRLLFRLFFSEFVLGRLGRDPSFFRYVEHDVAEHLLKRARHAMAELDPAENPYLQWILTGAHDGALPYALRPEHFDVIRANLDRLEWHCAPLEEVLDSADVGRVDRANFSNIFEYMSPENHRRLLARFVDSAAPGARMAYWNMLVHRQGAECLPERVRPLRERSAELYRRDKAFFYCAFYVDEVVA